MGRFYGEVGYANQVETDGVWKNVITVKTYTGSVKKINRRLSDAPTLNDNITTGTIISVIADPYALQNFMQIAYVEWMGVKWKAASVDASPPRLNIQLGGVYNEQAD